MFILVRHLPQLNTRVKESPSHVPPRPQRLPEESARLVANTVSILAKLPSLCSPAGEARGKQQQQHTHTPCKSFVLLLLLKPALPELFKSVYGNGAICICVRLTVSMNITGHSGVHYEMIPYSFFFSL